MVLCVFVIPDAGSDEAGRVSRPQAIQHSYVRICNPKGSRGSDPTHPSSVSTVSASIVTAVIAIGIVAAPAIMMQAVIAVRLAVRGFVPTMPAIAVVQSADQDSAHDHDHQEQTREILQRLRPRSVDHALRSPARLAADDLQHASGRASGAKSATRG